LTYRAVRITGVAQWASQAPTHNSPMPDLSLVIDSYRRCVARADFIDRFYIHLFEASPDIREKFRDTDLEQQRTMIRKAITTIIMQSAGIQAANLSLDRIAATHGKEGMNITPDMYQLWIDTMVRTVRECDSQCDHRVAETWRVVLSQGIGYLSRRGQG